MASSRNTSQRARRAVLDILPRSVTALEADQGSSADLVLGDQLLQIRWLGEGTLGRVRRALAEWRTPPGIYRIAVARRLSIGAREALSEAGAGWVDETGAAEIATGPIVISRPGRPPEPGATSKRWAPATYAVAEAVLCGTRATVSATQQATGLSTGSCTTALRFLTDLGLLTAEAGRGSRSARKLTEPDRFLQAYASAVEQRPSRFSLQVGVLWRDPIQGLVELGRRWTRAGLKWAATGSAAAAVIAPHLATVTSVEVYVEASTILGLEAIATRSELRPIDGGRLKLRPFPTVALSRLAEEIDGLRVAPWPRVFADLRTSGVRGEEAAEHLREVIHARRAQA